MDTHACPLFLRHKLIEVGAEPRDQFFLGHKARNAFLDLAALEKQQGGDAHYAKLHHKIGVLVCVDLHDLDFPLPVARQLLDDRVKHLARLTPDRAEIHQHGFR